MFSTKIRIYLAIFVLLSINILHSFAFDVNKDVIFQLYTPNRPNEYKELTESTPMLIDPRLPVRIFIHGFKGKEKTIERYKDAFLRHGRFNFIGVNWIIGANTINYLSAKRNIPFVGCQFVTKILIK